MTDEGRRKLAGVRHRAAGAARRRRAGRRSRSSVRCPQCGSARHPRAEPVRLDRVQVAVGLPRLPRAVRPLQGDLMTAAPMRTHRSSTRCAVAAIEPAHRRLRRDHLRRARRACAPTTPSRTASTSRSARSPATTCAATTRSARPPSSGRAPDRRQAAARRRVLRARASTRCGSATARGDDADRPLHHRRSTRRSREALRRGRGRLAASRRCCRSWPTCSRSSRARSVTLVYGNRTSRIGDVPRGARRPQGPLPGPVPAACTCSPASSRTSSCSPAGSTPTGCAGSSTALLPADDRRRVVPVRAVRRWSPSCARAAASRPASAPRASTPSCSTSTRRRGRRSPRWTTAPTAPRAVTIRLDGRGHDFALRPDGARRCSTRRSRVRADAPFACKGGVCGTCRARLVEGTVADGRQLRARARRGRARLRAHLPVAPDLGRRSCSTTTPDRGPARRAGRDPSRLVLPARQRRPLRSAARRRRSTTTRSSRPPTAWPSCSATRTGTTRCPCRSACSATRPSRRRPGLRQDPVPVRRRAGRRGRVPVESCTCWSSGDPAACACASSSTPRRALPP